MDISILHGKDTKNLTLDQKAQKLRDQGIDVVNTRGKNLGRDQFLKLLVAQLSHQDPMKPVEDKQFIAQMAQFSSLEQMTQVNKNLESLARQNLASQSFSLLGRKISGKSEDTGLAIQGTVKEIEYVKNKTILVTDKGKIAVDNVSKVQN